MPNENPDKTIVQGKHACVRKGLQCVLCERYAGFMQSEICDNNVQRQCVRSRDKRRVNRYETKHNAMMLFVATRISVV